MLRTFTVAVLLGLTLVGCAQDGPTAAVSSDIEPSYSAQEIPFRGSITTVTNTVIVPPTLFADATGEGTATQLGRFTATLSAVVDLVTSTSTGSLTFTAANGDQLSATFVGIEGVIVEPGVARLTEVATIIGGTGRFASATGTFTLVRFDNFGAGNPALGSGSFEGHIELE